MARREGPENLRILKEKLSFLPLKVAVEFFGSRPAKDELRSKTSQDVLRVESGGSA